MRRLVGKVACITGGGGGIGRATAERFAEEPPARLSAREGATNRGGHAHFVRCNVTERASIDAAVQKTVARYGKLDILHNTAGGSSLQDGPVTEAPEEELWRAIKLDLFGTFLCEPRLPFRRSSRPAAAPSST